MLFAGTASLISFKYSLYNEIVKKLKQRSISAGNRFLSKYSEKSRTSETLRNEIGSSLIMDVIRVRFPSVFYSSLAIFDELTLND